VATCFLADGIQELSSKVEGGGKEGSRDGLGGEPNERGEDSKNSSKSQPTYGRRKREGGVELVSWWGDLKGKGRRHIETASGGVSGESSKNEKIYPPK